MRLRGRILPVLFCFILIIPAQAQKWQKYIDKTNDKFNDGDYKKAEKFNEKLKKRALKKLGPDNPYMIDYYITKSKLEIANGEFSNFDTQLKLAVQLSLKNFGESSPHHAMELLEVADQFRWYGNYVAASKYAEQALQILQQSGNYKGAYKIRCDFVMMRIKAGQGFYQQAVALGNGIKEEMLNGITSKIVHFDPETKTEKEASPTKDEVKERQTKYAFLISYIGYCYGERGDFTQADSVFNAAEQWIRKNNHKVSPEYSQFLMFKGDIEDLRGDWKDSRSDFRNAYLNLKTVLKPAHYLIYDAQEKLIETYTTINRDTRANNEFTVFDAAIHKNFSRQSIYKVRSDLLDMELNPENQSPGTQEKYIAAILNVSFLPDNHPFREKVLDYLIENQTVQDKFKSSLFYFNKLISLQDTLLGENAPNYHITQVKLGTFYMDYTNNINDARDIYLKSFRNVIMNEFTDTHPLMADFYRFSSLVHYEFDQLDSSALDMQKALGIIKNKYGLESVEYGNEVDKIADLYIDLSKFKEAESYIDTANDILKHEAEGMDKTLYASSLETQAKLQKLEGEYDDAISTIKKSQKLIKRADVLNYNDFKGLETLADVNLSLGKYSSTEDLLTQSLEQKKNIYGDSSRFLIGPLLNYSDLLIINGDYPNAGKNITYATKITSDVYGESNSHYANCLIEQAKLNLALGDFEEGQQDASDAYNIQKKVFNNNNVAVANSLSLLGEISFYKGEDIKTVENYFLLSESVIVKLLGSDNPLFAENLKNLGIIYLAKSEYQRALSVLQQSKAIWQSKAGKHNNINTADIDVIIGDVYYGMRDYQNAQSSYEDAQKLYRKFFNKSHPKYVKTLSKLSKVSFMMGDTRNAKNYIEEALGNYLQFINDYFPSLSERGKAKFWNSIKPDFEYYNTLALRMSAQNPKMIGTLYDNALATKALLLNSSIKIRERILNSSDTTLHRLYYEWKDKNEVLTNALSMSPEEQQEEGINPDKLKSEIENIEKELSSHTSGFANTYSRKSIGWENVKESLGPSEAAVEMIRFRYFNHTFTDSVIYIGVYVTATSKNPDYFVFPDGKSMETRFLSAYRNAIRFKTIDQTSYDHFWKPFELTFGKATTIYLSPDGVFNQINMEAIPTPDGRFVLDNSNIVLVNNTKDLFLSQQQLKQTANAKTATLVGNPNFYASNKDKSEMQIKDGYVIKQLPGTEEEVKELGNILTTDGWKTKDYLQDSATETNLKKINDPEVFHIATHGFFTSRTPLKTELEGIPLSNYEALENPLLRTGLLLSGAGDVLAATSYNYNIESGILTAYEAMNLNLDNTRLVVLSACETGLGDVEEGEGVYGLQRAFLVAGAKTLIMSLFKVSDEVTQKLMITFYKKWLSTGNERQAFVDAKKEIRNEYIYPIYWGSFVMIGLDR